jgi:hypothetical protein
MGNVKAEPRRGLLIECALDGHIVDGDKRTALTVLKGVKTARRKSVVDFLYCVLNFRCHRARTSRVVVVSNSVEPALVVDMYLLVIADRFVGLVMPEQVQEEIQFDLDLLCLCGLFDLKSGVVMAPQVNRLLVDVNPDRFEVMGWMMMGVMLTVFMRGLQFRFHGHSLIAN